MSGSSFFSVLYVEPFTVILSRASDCLICLYVFSLLIRQYLQIGHCSTTKYLTTQITLAISFERGPLINLVFERKGDEQ
jgi:hypothetical protein